MGSGKGQTKRLSTQALTRQKINRPVLDYVIDYSLEFIPKEILLSPNSLMRNDEKILSLLEAEKIELVFAKEKILSIDDLNCHPDDAEEIITVANENGASGFFMNFKNNKDAKTKNKGKMILMNNYLTESSFNDIFASIRKNYPNSFLDNLSKKEEYLFLQLWKQKVLLHEIGHALVEYDTNEDKDYVLSELRAELFSHKMIEHIYGDSLFTQAFTNAYLNNWFFKLELHNNADNIKSMHELNDANNDANEAVDLAKTYFDKT